MNPSVERVSIESGIPVEYLTTLHHEYGTPADPYAEAVVLRRGVPPDIEDRWYGYTWRAYLAKERERRQPRITQ